MKRSRAAKAVKRGAGLREVSPKFMSPQQEMEGMMRDEKSVVLAQDRLTATVRTEVDPKQNSNIYLDLNLYNSSTDNSAGLTYTQQFTYPLLPESTDKYYAAVSSFTIPMTILPIFNWPGDDFFTVTLDYLGIDNVTYTSGPTPVLFVQQDNNPNDLSSASAKAVYSYQQFLTYINTAYATAFAALKLLVPGPGGFPSNTGEPPFLSLSANEAGGPGVPVSFSPSDQDLVTFCAQYDFYQASQSAGLVNGVFRIYMNSNLFYYFDSWNTVFNGRNLTSGHDFQILMDFYGRNFCDPLGGHQIPTSTANTGYLTMQQEFNSTYLWSDLSEIQIQVWPLPIRQELQGNTSVGNQSAGYNASPILASISPLVNASRGATGLRSMLVYEPAQPKLVDLMSNTPVMNLTVEVRAVLKDGSSSLLRLTPNRNANIRLLFQHRNVNR